MFDLKLFVTLFSLQKVSVRHIDVRFLLTQILLSIVLPVMYESSNYLAISTFLNSYRLTL